jgi:cell wall-associated NlpC family hydrolase
MDRRNAMFLLGLAMLAGCSSAPRRQPAPPRPTSSPQPPVPLPPPSAETLDDVLSRDPDPKRNELVLVALSQLGIPYRWGGLSPLTGFDCSGLVVYVYQQVLQLKLPRVTYGQARESRPIDVDDLRPADLVFFNTMGPPFSHVGIYIGNRRFVHAPVSNEVVRIERLQLPYWMDRFNGGRRVIG